MKGSNEVYTKRVARQRQRNEEKTERLSISQDVTVSEKTVLYETLC